MQKGRHIGKIVIKMPEDHSKLPAEKSTAGITFRSDVSYFLVGGLGGLGRSISAWMVEHGAKHLIYLSRSGGQGPEDASITEDLQAQGCEIQVFKGSVVNLDDVQNAKNKANAPGMQHVINLSDMTNYHWSILSLLLCHDIED